MSIEAGTVGVRVFASKAEVLAAKPWLVPESVVAQDGYWIATDAYGDTGVVGALPQQAVPIIGVVDGQSVSAPGWGNPGLENFGATKQSDNYGSSPVDASLFGGGLIPLPGLGAVGSGKFNWLLWGLIFLGATLILSRGGGKALRRA